MIFDALHLAHAQCVHRTQGVDVQPVFRRLGRNALRDLGQCDALVQAQPHVFGHREGVEQAEMLEHHGNTQRARLLRVAHLHRLAVEVHAAFVGLDRAVDDFHQRGFARAVFAQHGMDLAGLHRQRHIAVGHHRRVALGNAHQLQPGRHCAGHARSARRAGDGSGTHAGDCLSVFTNVDWIQKGFLRLFHKRKQLSF